MTELAVNSTDLRDYARSHGWVMVPEAVKDRIFVLSNPNFPRRQLVFAIDETAPDYAESVLRAAEKLAVLEGKTLDAVLKQVQTAQDDTFALRITGVDEDVALPLTFAGSLIAGAEQLLLAAASSVLKPQTHHPRLGRTEAQQVVEAARFRHTEAGSFVLRVSCPVFSLPAQELLFPEEKKSPFVREVLLHLKNSLSLLVDSIETDRLQELIEEQRSSPAPMLSSNLCEAVTRFQEEQLRNALEVQFSWAAALPMKSKVGGNTIRFQREYFSRVEEVRRVLRADERHQEDTFVGTVEQLDGPMNADGRREGDVVLALLQDGERVRARTILNAEQYLIAHRAHVTDGAFVMVTGRLHPGRQPRLLTDLRVFELIERPTGSSSGQLNLAQMAAAA